jgi:hypothetical protein
MCAAIAAAGLPGVVTWIDGLQMNSIKWIDAENGLVCMEAGIVGQDVKRRLEVYRMPRVPASHMAQDRPKHICCDVTLIEVEMLAERGLHHRPRTRLARCLYPKAQSPTP